MKRQIILALFSAWFACNAFAANLATVDRYVDDFMVRMGKAVVLTDEQSQALANILYQGIGEREDVIESYQGKTDLRSRHKMKEELESLNNIMRSEAREILNEQQFAAFTQIQDENREALKKRLSQ